MITFIFKNSKGDLIIICEDTLFKAKQLLVLHSLRASDYVLHTTITPSNKIASIYFNELKPSKIQQDDITSSN